MAYYEYNNLYNRAVTTDEKPQKLFVEVNSIALVISKGWRSDNKINMNE